MIYLIFPKIEGRVVFLSPFEELVNLGLTNKQIISGNIFSLVQKLGVLCLFKLVRELRFFDLISFKEKNKNIGY